MQALRPFRTDFHLLDAHSQRRARGDRRELRLDARRGTTAARRRSCSPAGSTPENVGEAIAATRPFAVDTASGTEAEPGRKDPAKLAAFFRAVAAADAASGAAA